MKAKVFWKGHPSEFNEIQWSNYLNKISLEHDIPLENIDSHIQYLMDKENAEISQQAFTDFFSHENIKNTYLNYFKNVDNVFDVDDFFTLDKVVTQSLPKEVDAYNVKRKKFELLYIKGKNIFSYGEFFRDFTKNKGLNLITSNPSNRGGKTSLVRLASFLIYGNKMEFATKKIRSYDSFFNLFTNDNEAHIEGEIKIQNTIYHLSRHLKKSKSGKISHSFNLKSRDVESTEWILENFKDATQTLKRFEQAIGSYEDYKFASFFEKLTAEKWIEIGNTDRYKKMVKYLGLSLLKDKYDTAKKMYDDFLKKNAFNSTRDLSKLLNEKKELINEIEHLKKEVQEHSVNYQSQREVFERVSTLFSELSYQVKSSNIKTYPDNFELNTKAKLENISNKINEVKQTISSINPEELNKNASGLKLKQEKLSQQMSLLSVEVDMAELSKLKSKIDVYDVSSFDVKISNIGVTIEEQKEEFNRLKFETTNLRQQIKDTPLFSVCDKCGEKTNNKSKIEKWNSIIDDNVLSGKDLQMSLKKLEKDLIQVKNDKQKFIKKHQQNIQNAIDNLYSEAKNQLDTRKKIIQAQSKEVANNLNSISTQLRKLSDSKLTLLNLENEKTKLENEINDFLTSKVQLNEVIKLKSRLKNAEIDKIKESNLLEQLNQTLFSHKNKLQNAKNNLKNLEETIISNEEFLNQDKVYKEYLFIHSKNGLAKFLLDSLLPLMNNTLKKVMKDDFDFGLEIKFEDSSIEYYIVVNGEQMPLYRASGYEKTVCCIALHYVHVLLTALPLSNNIVLDEIIGSVADSNVVPTMNMINRLKEIYDVIDIIVHGKEQISMVKDYIDNQITVSKNNKVSTFNII